MKTDIATRADTGQEVFYVHSLPLISHIDGAGHLGFINRIPQRIRVIPSVMQFLTKDADMYCFQIPTPQGAPMNHNLNGMMERLNEYGDILAAQMGAIKGQYVGLALIFPMTLVAIEDMKVEDVTIRDVQRAKAAGKAISKPGLLATHDGTVMQAQYQKGRYRVLGFNPFSADGTRGKLWEAHIALCKVADNPPKSGRRLQDMYPEGY